MQQDKHNIDGALAVDHFHKPDSTSCQQELHLYHSNSDGKQHHILHKEEAHHLQWKRWTNTHRICPRLHPAHTDTRLQLENQRQLGEATAIPAAEKWEEVRRTRVQGKCSSDQRRPQVNGLVRESSTPI